MSLLKRFRRDEAPAEAPCPRCGVPTPMGNPECTACGWDTREAYHGSPGSWVGVGGETDAEK
jgi:hypothetical protein